MAFRRILVLAILLAPGMVRGQNTPEDLLSARSQLYFRWDGQKAHRAAYLKTGLGKMMQGDTGKLFDNLLGLLHDNLSASLTARSLLEGEPPEKVQKRQTEVIQAMKLPGILSDQGLLLAAEVQSYLPPAGQVTLILPDVGDQAASLFAALRLAVETQGEEVKEIKAEKRDVSTVNLGLVHLGWWREGKHAVVVLSSMKTDVAVARMLNANDGRLTESASFKKLREFKGFETSARAFLDVQALAAMAGVLSKDVKQTIETLGLDSLRSISFQSGFEGDAERGLVELTYSGERKGLLAATTAKPFKLTDVPTLPSDTLSWSMSTFDAASYYDSILKAADTLLATFAPNEAAQLREFIKEADRTLGIDIRKDLLGALGDRFLQYTSPGEGVFTLSQTMAIRVKDGSKLLDTLDQAAKGLASQAGAKVAVKKRKYRDVEVREVRINEQGFFFLPTYAIVDDWLVISYYPQPVQGFILRAKGELPAWKPDETIMQSLAKLPREFQSISVSDPRPSVKQVFALAPLIGSTVRSFFPDTKFDPALIPNGHEATKHLFPNVSVMSDDGKTTRLETRASLSLPLDLTGLDTYVLAFSAIGFLSAFAAP